VNAKDRAPLHKRRLGQQLKQLRVEAGMTQEEVARELGYSDSKISRFESGQLPDLYVMFAMLDRYGLTYDQWPPFRELWQTASRKGWWTAYKLIDQGYVSMEHEASVVREYQNSFVPGLLQTEAYARELFAASQMPRSRKTIDNQVKIRLRRQDRLSADDPLVFEAIIQECVLTRPDHDPSIRRAQLLRIAERAAWPNVTVRVVPESAGKHDGLYGSMIVLRFADREVEPVAYVEHALGAEHIKDPEHVATANLRLDQLAKLALDPAESITFLERMAAEL
jgi:transcriptional regulator with XRE-family HTH domain